MKKFLAITFAALSLAVVLSGSKRPERGNVKYVNTEIGGVGFILQPTRPTVQIPNQMLRLSPGRADLLDVRISSYPLTLTSHRLASVFGFLPVKASSAEETLGKRLLYDNERTEPYLYSADLEGSAVSCSCSSKSAIFKIVFDPDTEGRSYLRFTSLAKGCSYRATGPHSLEGEAAFNGMKAYLHAEFDTELQEAFSGKDGSSAVLAVPDGKATVMMRYGISYISCDQASENLEREIPSFDLDATSAAAKKAWNSALGQIDVYGGTESHTDVFYTALYRCFERMVDINENGRYYSAFDHKIHSREQPFFVDNWIWDTYIALEPLQTILNPDMEELKLDSYCQMYRQCGNMPSFAVTWGDWPAMTGNYAAVWFADALCKGLKFDVETAYEGCRRNSLERTHIPWRNGPLTEIDEFYNEKGWFPSLHPGEEETVKEVDTKWERRQAVAVTTAFSYADWALASLAGSLGKQDDKELFLKRAQFYRNVFRQDKGFMWPKDKDGEWIEPFDPRFADRMYFTENNAYIFNWDVKHDLWGLASLMGGRDAAQKKLDEMFGTPLGMSKFRYWAINPDHSGNVGQFSMGNEPCLHIPYLYNYYGAPWKTQKLLHMLIDTFFTDTVYGMPGDEDGGGMSSFVVFTMLGFFPVTPGIPVYVIGTPFFEKSVIHLPGGKDFVVKARNFSEDNKYIKSAKLNGEPLNRVWLTHEELVSGGVLELEMSRRPDKGWCASEDAVPVSGMEYLCGRD